MSLTHLTRPARRRAVPTGGDVSDSDWAAFETDTLAGAFPAGFTVYNATGAWADSASGGTIHESTVIVEVAHGGTSEELSAIRMVAMVYKTLFQQDAVMVSTVPVEVEFI